MNTPHKHAELIKAWADGAKIEYRINFNHEWTSAETPSWNIGSEYRIKPEPKPDIVYYGVFDRSGDGVFLDACFTRLSDVGDQLKLTFDGTTGNLKSAEVL